MRHKDIEHRVFRRRWGRLGTLRWERGFPRLVIDERYQRRVRLVLRLFTVTGILSSAVSLPPLTAIAVSVALVCAEQFLERTAFYWTTLYVQPVPNFEYDDSKWDSMAFVVPPPGVYDASPRCVGLVFSDPAYASDLFALLRAWNYGATEDHENNICLSFIVEEDHYYVFLYPSFDRRSVKESHARWRKSQRLAQYGKEHFGLIVSLVICKEFSAMHGFGLGRFTDTQRDGDPFLLVACLKAGSTTSVLPDVPAIKKWNYKYKHASELRPDEFEKVYLRTPKHDVHEDA
jgi:hypothetical protein